MNNAEVLVKFKGNTEDLDQKTNKASSNITSKLGSAAKSMGTAFLKGTAVVGAAMAGMVAKGIAEYGKLEQSIGGTKLLFGDAADYIQQKSKEAYQYAGLSANEYLEQVNGLAVGLKNAMGGNEQAAAKLADKVITAEADIVAATGNSQEAVQNAFNGIMKGNYMMLDNLQLGIKPTKEGMQEVIDKMNEWNATQGRVTNYQMGNYADMQAALVDYVEAQGLAGYAAGEASSTIQGSMKSMKAAFTNFLSGAGGIDEVISTVQTFGENVMNAIVELAPKIVDGVVKLVNALIPKLPALIEKLLPTILKGVIDLVNGIIKVLPTLIRMLAQMLPTIIDALIKGLVLIINTLAEIMPDLIPTLVDAIIDIIPVLIENLPLFIEAGIKLIGALAEGLIKAIPKLTFEAIPKIIMSIINVFKNRISQIKETGKNIIQGIWNGIKSFDIVKAVKNLAKSMLKGMKSVLGIHSPSTEFAMVGKFSVLGYTEALDKMKGDVQKQIDSTFGLSPQLTGSMQNSFSPNVQVYNNVNVEQDPLGQMVSNIKTFSGGAKNDYNYGSGI